MYVQCQKKNMQGELAISTMCWPVGLLAHITICLDAQFPFNNILYPVWLAAEAVTGDHWECTCIDITSAKVDRGQPPQDLPPNKHPRASRSDS